MIIQQKILCYRCKSIIKIIDKEKKTNVKDYKISYTPCEKCKKITSEKRSENLTNLNKTRFGSLVSERMKIDNPMKLLENQEKVSKSLKIKYENGEIKSPFSNPLNRGRKTLITQEERFLISQRLKENNPMKSKETCKKMSETFRRRIEEGTIIPLRGPKHWLWKGGQNTYSYIRLQLYKPWIYPILQRDNFSCTECGKANTELHVHHVKPFIQILDETLLKYNVSRIDCDRLIESNFCLFSNIVNDTVNAHKLCYGVSVCPDCHRKLDPRYRRKTN